MRPLIIDDLMSLEDYAPRRRELFEAQRRYIDRYRRARIGPTLALVFENRQTLWFRIQELIHIARVSDKGRVQEELDIYNRLLPQRDELHASMLIDAGDPARQNEEMSRWRSFAGRGLVFHLGERSYEAELLTCRPEDLSIGTAHWARFRVDGTARTGLADFRRPAWLQVRQGDYQHQSLSLSDDVRQSLIDDLVMSDRDSARDAVAGERGESGK
jgi:hypothetical protein